MYTSSRAAFCSRSWQTSALQGRQQRKREDALRQSARGWPFLVVGGRLGAGVVWWLLIGQLHSGRRRAIGSCGAIKQFTLVVSRCIKQFLLGVRGASQHNSNGASM